MFDTEYIDFMRLLLKYIEPRFVKRRTIIIEELDEFGEVIFFVTGTFKVGYSINGKKIWVKAFKMNLHGRGIG